VPRRRSGLNSAAATGGLESVPDVTGLIDFSRPVAVLFVAVLHGIPDRDDPAGIARGAGIRWIANWRRLASGGWSESAAGNSPDQRART
jgi:hypothetical protein